MKDHSIRIDPFTGQPFALTGPHTSVEHLRPFPSSFFTSSGSAAAATTSSTAASTVLQVPNPLQLQSQLMLPAHGRKRLTQCYAPIEPPPDPSALWHKYAPAVVSSNAAASSSSSEPPSNAAPAPATAITVPQHAPPPVYGVRTAPALDSVSPAAAGAGGEAVSGSSAEEENSQDQDESEEDAGLCFCSPFFRCRRVL